MTATVLVGPRTRLGRAVTRRADGPVLAVARDPDDAAAIAALPEHASTLVIDHATASVADAVAGLPAGPVRLVIAALGPVHPGIPRASYDAQGVVRDLGIVEQVLRAAGTSRPVRLVLVSTVIALAPGEDRRYYGGWKALVEQQVQQLVDDHVAAGGKATLSVLFPGRLLDASEHRGRRRVHTRYSSMARRTLSAADDGPRSRVVGVDARIWLAVSSISFVTRSLSPATRRSVPPTPTFGDTSRGASQEEGG